MMVSVEHMCATVLQLHLGSYQLDNGCANAPTEKHLSGNGRKKSLFKCLYLVVLFQTEIIRNPFSPSM